MQPSNVELTKIGNKERLMHLVERAQNIFKVCVRNYENDVIKFVEDIDRAVANPQQVNGWDRPWQNAEIVKLKVAAQKCQESKNVAEEAKDLTLKIAGSLAELSKEVYSLAEMIEECEEFANEFLALEDAVTAAIAKLDTKNNLSDSEQTLREKLDRQLFLVVDSSKVLMSLRPSANKQRENLADNIEGVTKIFFDEELPERKFKLQQEIDSFVGLIDDLHTKVVKTYESHNKIISELAGFIDSMDFTCKEIVFVVEDMLNGAKQQYTDTKNLLDSVS